MKTITIRNEACREIEGFGRYCISESGNIYRIKALNKKEQKMLDDGSEFITQMTILFREREGVLRQGFCSLTNSEGKLYNLAVAPLIVRAFANLPKRFNGKNGAIEFIDGNKRNLHISNLRIANTKPGNTKLTKTEVAEIKKLIKEGLSLKELSMRFGVSDMQINRIKTGENWGNGKRKILAPQAPFPIKDGKVRRFISLFKREEIDPKIRKPFYVKRNPEEPTDNQIVGILKGYKLSHNHVNITRARALVIKLNEYFFTPKKEEEEEVPVFNEFYKSFES